MNEYRCKIHFCTALLLHKCNHFTLIQFHLLGDIWTFVQGVHCLCIAHPKTQTNFFFLKTSLYLLKFLCILTHFISYSIISFQKIAPIAPHPISLSTSCFLFLFLLITFSVQLGMALHTYRQDCGSMYWENFDGVLNPNRVTCFKDGPATVTT